jgi:hypothetical protein
MLAAMRTRWGQIYSKADSPDSALCQNTIVLKANRKTSLGTQEYKLASDHLPTHPAQTLNNVATHSTQV